MRARRALFLGVLVLFAATGPALAAGEINRQLLGEPESLDPQLISGSTDFDLVEDLFEGLTAQGADGKTIPGIAERWEVSADRLRWTFHLRPDLTWSDGTALTADDMVWSLRRAVSPATASPYAASLSPIKNARESLAGTADPATLGVAASNARTVIIDLAEPTPFFADLMTLPVSYPLPRAAVERWGADWIRPPHLVSDGAFQLEDWTPQAEVRLARNPHYHGAASVTLDHVHWLLAEDRKAGLRRFRAGELDAIQLAAEDYSWAGKQFAGALRSVPLLATRYLVTNMAKGLIADDARLREALSLAIDRDVLVQKIDTRGQAAAWGLVPPGVTEYPVDQGPGLDSAARRAKAPALWDAVRQDHPTPIKITLLAEKDDVDHRIAGALAAMWHETLGVEVVLEEQEWRIYHARVRDDNFEIVLSGWYADYADPWTFLANFRTDAGQLNSGRYQSKVYDAGLDAAKHAEGTARTALLAQAEQQLLHDHAVIPIEFSVSQRLVNPAITGWGPDPLDMNLSRFLGLHP